MVILAFYPVSNDLNWERHEFDGVTDEVAFKQLWDNFEVVGVRMFDMESHIGDRDTYGIGPWMMPDSDDFEEDYNNEDFDGGWWCKVLHVPSDFVRETIN